MNYYVRGSKYIAWACMTLLQYIRSLLCALWSYIFTLDHLVIELPIVLFHGLGYTSTKFKAYLLDNSLISCVYLMCYVACCG